MMFKCPECGENPPFRPHGMFCSDCLKKARESEKQHYGETHIGSIQIKIVPRINTYRKCCPKCRNSHQVKNMVDYNGEFYCKMCFALEVENEL